MRVALVARKNFAAGMKMFCAMRVCVRAMENARTPYLSDIFERRHIARILRNHA
jgi:hypothetical protein